jgi:hypothetical protein
MSNRGKLRRKLVLPVTVVRGDGEQKQLAHTLDVTEISARLGGLNMMLESGEIIEIQRGARKAKFQVYWMGAPGTELEGQAGIRGIDPGKSIWSAHLPPDQPDVVSDTLHLRRKTPPSRIPIGNSSEHRPGIRYECSCGATLRAPGSNYPTRVQLKSIHLDGLFVESVTTFPLNTVLSLEMQIEGIAVETAGTVLGSTPRVGMEIAFHKVLPETRRKIVLALQKLKQKAWDQQRVPALPPPPELRLAPAPVANGMPPINCIDAGRVLVAICKTLSSDFDHWKSTRTMAEIEELRKAVADLQDRLAPAPAVDIGEFIASGISKRGGPA